MLSVTAFFVPPDMKNSLLIENTPSLKIGKYSDLQSFTFMWIVNVVTTSTTIFLVLPFYAGLKDGRILDSQISASSVSNSDQLQPSDGRLDVQTIFSDGFAPAQRRFIILQEC